MRAQATVWLLLALTALTTACSPTCQTTCQRFYDETECAAGPAGIPNDDAINSCLTICQDALQVTGEPVTTGDRRFDPQIISPGNISSTLENEQEAAAWMDCVASFADDECYLLDQQYCVKIF